MTKENRQKKDVENKMFRKGEIFGIQFMLHVMAWVMVETEHYDAETIQRIMDEMEDYCVDFGKRNINLKDLSEVLHDEHGIVISFGKKERVVEY